MASLPINEKFKKGTHKVQQQAKHGLLLGNGKIELPCCFPKVTRDDNESVTSWRRIDGTQKSKKKTRKQTLLGKNAFTDNSWRTSTSCNAKDFKNTTSTHKKHQQGSLMTDTHDWRDNSSKRWMLNSKNPISNGSGMSISTQSIQETTTCVLSTFTSPHNDRAISVDTLCTSFSQTLKVENIVYEAKYFFPDPQLFFEENQLRKPQGISFMPCKDFDKLENQFYVPVWSATKGKEQKYFDEKRFFPLTGLLFMCFYTPAFFV